MPVTIRAAAPDDLPALVRLRLANADRHVELDPTGHRRPDPEAVARHFAAVLTAGSGVVVLVADVAGEVVGMVELVLRPPPPDHQILVPAPTADVHTVVLPGRRGRGVGGALLAAAERVATDHGVTTIYATILARNEDAARFYASAGFGPRGVILRKQLDRPPAGRHGSG